MEERVYNLQPSSASYDIYPRPSTSRACPPNDMPAPATCDQGDQCDAEWAPNDSPIDPHDEPYEAPNGDPPSTGPLPPNVDVVTPGPFSRSRSL
jgi:hypothetical protein